MMRAQRDQVELRAFDLDSTLGADHAARTVWAFVQSLDMTQLHAAMKAVQGRPGRPAIDPAILMALWLWATIDGVGSAREIDRLCERDDAYRWLCGGVGVNYHSLADFRTEHERWLDAQLTRSVASLLERRLVTLNVVSQDGMRVRASAKASSMRRKERLQQLLDQARAQVHALKAELGEDAGASSRRKQAARERAARQREERLAQALATLHKIEHKAESNKPTRKSPGKRTDKDEGPLGRGASPKSEGKKAPREPRVSTSDPQARVMKMADGGFRPAFNAQLAVDADTQIIAAVEVVNAGSDMHQLAPMHAAVHERYGVVPEHWLADGGFAKFEAIEQLAERGTQAVVPPPHSRHRPEVDPCAPRDTDSAAIATLRQLIGSPEGQALYRRRAATVECANAQLRRRGLWQFNVRGLVKARAVLLWHALAHNLLRMATLNYSFSG
ncbi:MAG TPA: IS1182 family transposase [Burkholderiaceae bacterium]|nr:IS1182 family transposase [Burkholderiaceae bacterium]